MNLVQERLQKAAQDSFEAMKFLSSQEALVFMEKGARMMAEVFSSGKKILVAGNGGSLCDASHFAEELTGCFRKPRKALPAIVLSEPGHLTCVGNDFGYDAVFKRGVEAFGNTGDIFLALSTSGNSQNILLAVDEAVQKGMQVICLLGKGGGKLRSQTEHTLIVPNCTTSDRIQEVHMACLHMIIEGIELLLFSEDVR